MPDMPFPVPSSTLTTSRFQAKPATFLIPADLIVRFVIKDFTVANV